MKHNYKKGFSLAEVLVLFLLISTMLAAFAPIMTRRAHKEVDLDCPTGTKHLVAEYSIPGNYTFTAPENITEDAIITLVGGGGRGGNAVITKNSLGINHEYFTGAGGGGGAYSQYSFELAPNQSYTVVVGAGGTNTGSYGGDSTFGSLIAKGGSNASTISVCGFDLNDGDYIDVPGNYGSIAGGNGGPASSGKGLITSSAGANGVIGTCTGIYARAKNTEYSKAGVGGGNSIFSEDTSLGGSGGQICTIIGKCSELKHGKQGKGYEESGLSSIGFVAGTGGGGGGFDFAAGNNDGGYGGYGGSGYVKIEYQVRCNL